MKPENVTCPECDGPMVPRTSASVCCGLVAGRASNH